jgi:hypothetical protein
MERDLWEDSGKKTVYIDTGRHQENCKAGKEPK